MLITSVGLFVLALYIFFDEMVAFYHADDAVIARWSFFSFLSLDIALLGIWISGLELYDRGFDPPLIRGLIRRFKLRSVLVGVIIFLLIFGLTPIATRELTEEVRNERFTDYPALMADDNGMAHIYYRLGGDLHYHIVDPSGEEVYRFSAEGCIDYRLFYSDPYLHMFWNQRSDFHLVHYRMIDLGSMEDAVDTTLDLFPDYEYFNENMLSSIFGFADGEDLHFFYDSRSVFGWSKVYINMSAGEIMETVHDPISADAASEQLTSPCGIDMEGNAYYVPRFEEFNERCFARPAGSKGFGYINNSTISHEFWDYPRFGPVPGDDWLKLYYHIPVDTIYGRRIEIWSYNITLDNVTSTMVTTFPALHERNIVIRVDDKFVHLSEETMRGGGAARVMIYNDTGYNERAIDIASDGWAYSSHDTALSPSNVQHLRYRLSSASQVERIDLHIHDFLEEEDIETVIYEREGDQLDFERWAFMNLFMIISLVVVWLFLRWHGTGGEE